mmetsp:Transcript_21289/g.34813  ORF Transcript_21289/g.34813 Transcript_21289/m.34813 type:complete len:84 (+) Transcript_21289:304-555(+)
MFLPAVPFCVEQSMQPLGLFHRVVDRELGPWSKDPTGDVHRDTFVESRDSFTLHMVPQVTHHPVTVPLVLKPCFTTLGLQSDF